MKNIIIFLILFCAFCYSKSLSLDIKICDRLGCFNVFYENVNSYRNVVAPDGTEYLRINYAKYGLIDIYLKNKDVEIKKVVR